MINIIAGGYRIQSPVAPGATFTSGTPLVPLANGYGVTSSAYSTFGVRIVDPNYSSARRDVVATGLVETFAGNMVIQTDSSLISGTAPTSTQQVDVQNGMFVAITSGTGVGMCVGVSGGIYTIQIFG